MNLNKSPKELRADLDAAMLAQQELLDEKRFESSVTDPIVDAAINLVDKSGEDKGNYRAGTYIVRSYATEGTDSHKIPTLYINVPREEVADRFGWRVELTFGNQDTRQSQHILINKDGSIRVSMYDGRSDEFMSRQQAENFSNHFRQIISEITQDLPE